MSKLILLVVNLLFVSSMLIVSRSEAADDTAISAGKPEKAIPTPRLTLGLNLRDDPKGPTVDSVLGDSPSYEKILPGDIIVLVNARTTPTFDAVIAMVASAQADRVVRLLVSRDGTMVPITAELADHNRPRRTLNFKMTCTTDNKTEMRAVPFEVWEPRGDEDPIRLQAGRIERNQHCALDTATLNGLEEVFATSRDKHLGVVKVLTDIIDRNTAKTTAAAPSPPPATSPDMSVAECDRLAAHPGDKTRRAPGVYPEKMEVRKAFDACQAAAAVAGSDATTIYQYGRTTEQMGRPNDAFTLYMKAYKMGHVQAAWNATYLLSPNDNAAQANGSQLLPIYIFIAKSGDPDGLWQVGNIYYNGDAGIPHTRENQNKGLAMACQAARAGSEGGQRMCTQGTKNLAQIDRNAVISDMFRGVFGGGGGGGQPEHGSSAWWYNRDNAQMMRKRDLED